MERSGIYSRFVNLAFMVDGLLEMLFNSQWPLNAILLFLKSGNCLTNNTVAGFLNETTELSRDHPLIQRN